MDTALSTRSKLAPHYARSHNTARRVTLCVVPLFGAMFADFGARLPLPTEILISLQGRLGLALLATTVIALLIVQQFLSSHSSRCIIVNVVAIVVPLLFIPLVVLAMFLPILSHGGDRQPMNLITNEIHCTI